jgi:3-hydroxyisobutyrate dehydrogenase
MNMAKPQVAFLGLGIMGSGMAARLANAGFPLTVYNRNRKKAIPLEKGGAKIAGSAREAVANAEIVVSMVSDDAASRGVWLGENGALAGVKPGTLLIESSTLTVDWVKELAAAAGKQKCTFVDAPVTGTKPHAASGELFFLVGGSAAALEVAKPLLEVMGRGFAHLGPVGSGALMKLVNNVLAAVQAASFAEVSALIDAGGLDREKAWAILTNGAPGSPLIKTISSRSAANDLTVNFALRLMAKDIRYTTEEAAKRGLTFQTATAALKVFEQAVAKGYGESDLSAVIKSQQA